MRWLQKHVYYLDEVDTLDEVDADDDVDTELDVDALENKFIVLLSFNIVVTVWTYFTGFAKNNK